jgi:hypothetical protein
VPLRAFHPSISSPSPVSDVLPVYTPVYVSPIPVDIPNFAPDASPADSRPSIDILIDHPSQQQPSGQAPKSPLASVDESSDQADTEMKGRKPAIAAAGTFLSLTVISQIYQQALFPKITAESERNEDRSWVASSHSWLDRKVCDWFGVCGLAHLNESKWTNTDGHRRQKIPPTIETTEGEKVDLSAFWKDASSVTNPKDWPDDERRIREIPEYVLEYAPLIHLYSGEEFWPGDIAEHLIHTTPHLNYTPLQASSDHPNLTNLNNLNRWGRFVYLQSDDNVEDRPKWLGGETNIPNAPDDSDQSDSETSWSDADNLVDVEPPKDVDGKEASWWNVGIGDTTENGGIRPPPGATTSPIAVPTDTSEGEELVRPDEAWQPELGRRKLGKQIVGGRSDAPAVLIVVDKGNGVVDAFFFFFYSYNLGNKVFNVRFGNHVGDWEHTVVRFQHGEPKAVFFSEHSFGEAYTYNALEKIGKRVRRIMSMNDQTLTITSLWDILLLEPTRCMQYLERTHMCCRAAFFTTRQIGDLSGIPF